MNLRAVLIAALLAAPALAAGGCSTKRVLTIHSDPPGARVWVNGQEMGTTPVDVPFVHYGRLEVRLERQGYQSLAGDLEVPSRIDGYPVIDIPFELTVRERRFTWTGRMAPLVTDPDEADARAVFDRARAMRERTHREVAEPGAPASPGR